MNHSAASPHHAERANSTRIALLWAGIRDSLWFVPALCTATAVVLALVVVRFDRGWRPSGWMTGMLFSGGAEGARGVLSAVVGSLITVTGVIFSVTIVALQLASSQFTPRVLRGFMADRANQVVLGIFIGTFTYAIMVLRSVTSEEDARPAFVPEAGVTVAIVLVLVSIGALIYFIDHAARSIQASVILAREAEHTLHRVERLFPRQIGSPEGDAPVVRPPSAPAGIVLAERGGYLLAVHADSLFDLAESRRLTVRMEPPIGGFVLVGEPLASVWPRTALDDTVIDAVRDAFVLGDERTPEQDAELGIIVIADMAVRALSPGINDPTTASLCIDRLAEILARLGTAADPVRSRVSDSGDIRLLARQTTFARAVGLAFDQIRHFGAANPTIAKKLLDTLGRLGMLVTSERREVLVEQLEMTLAQAQLGQMIPGDLRRVEHLAATNLAKLREGAEPSSGEDDG
jgi:uncharacterized membrane protein